MSEFKLLLLWLTLSLPYTAFSAPVNECQLPAGTPCTNENCKAAGYDGNTTSGGPNGDGSQKCICNSAVIQHRLDRMYFLQEKAGVNIKKENSSTFESSTVPITIRK